ncbi:MAG: hypothetical protein E7454_07570, partial [Ruminococcaceae bacterium]|nr:hypothetical protein [Oscillospiraceae bacterium]
SVYLYDDKVIITFNYKDGSKTISLSQIENTVFNSDINAHALPKKSNTIRCWTFLIWHGLERAAPVRTLVQKLRAGEQFLARGKVHWN